MRVSEMRSENLWQSLGSLSGREAISIALGSAAPMIVMWFLAPALEEFVGPTAAPAGRAWTFRWVWFIPYPYPFTWRAGLAVTIMGGVPLGFFTLWVLARWSVRR